MNPPDSIIPAVPSEFRRGAVRDEPQSVAEAARLLNHMAQCVGAADHGDHEILDVGCGVKFTQAILTHDLAIGAYTGVDVYAAMIEFLRGAVDDPRFDYHVLDAHNEMYNPSGAPLAGDTDIGVGDRRFDLVCGLSLYTHLAPHDFGAMLALMRRHVKPRGHLYFSAFLNESSPGGLGLMDRWFRNLGDELAVAVDEGREAPAFTDLSPDHPLLHAVYSRPHAVELVEANGWEIEAIHDPIDIVQHQFVCRPS